MNVELVDESGEIRATAFNQEIDRLNMLEQGKVFKIRGGRVKMAKKEFNKTNNPYEITFGSDTQVHTLACVAAAVSQ